MKDIAIKILSHFSKNALATMVVLMALIIIKFGYKGFIGKIDSIIDKQEHIERKVDAGFKKGRENDSAMKADIKNIRLDQVTANGKQDIIISTLPEVKRLQIKQYEQLSNQIRNEQRREPLLDGPDVFIPPEPKELVQIDNEMPEIKKKFQIQPQPN